jgi:hypothetical protein
VTGAMIPIDGGTTAGPPPKRMQEVRTKS